jgi:hypothetical protein
MPTRDAVKMIRYMLGINRRDGGDLVRDNQFYTLQNFYQKTKGLLYKREGTTTDVVAADIPLANRITAMHRHYGVLNERFTLYHCEPDATAFPAPTTDMTVVQAAGSLFPAGGTFTVGYSWVGSGCESFTHDQSYTVVGTNQQFTFTVPAFPTGVRAANIYLYDATGVPWYTLIGVITTSGGSFTWKLSPHLGNSGRDALGTLTKCRVLAGGGTLKRGIYYISACWYTAYTGAVGSCYPRLTQGVPSTIPGADKVLIVRVEEDNSSIEVNHWIAGGASTNGASNVAFFVGTKPPEQAPMLFLGVRPTLAAANSSTGQPQNVLITSLPTNTNAQSCNVNVANGGAAYKTEAQFAMGGLFTIESAQTDRKPFLMKKDSSGTLTEVMWSGSASGDRSNQLSPYTIYADTEHNRKTSLCTPTGVLPVMVSYSGLVYIATSAQPLVQTDGYTLAGLMEYYNGVATTDKTVQPGHASFVGVFKDQLIMLVPDYKNQIFGAKTLDPRNWVDGGAGSALRFITVGDPFSDGIQAASVVGYTTGTEGPRTYILALKKSSAWVYSGIPDTASGVYASAEQLSGRTGCAAPLSIAQTPNGVVFLGSDGDVYLARGAGEPIRIGSGIRPSMSHLVADDSLMKKCSAVYHDGFYKLSYPSASTSTYNDAQWWADMRVEGDSPIAWSGPHIGVAVGQQVVFVGESDNSLRYACRPDALGTIRLDDPSTFQDLGVSISSVIEWKTTRFGAEMHGKRYTGMVFDAYYDTTYAHEVMVEGFADAQYTQKNKPLSTGAGVWDASAYDGGLWGDALYVPITVLFGPDNLTGRTFKWKLTHANNAQMIIAAAGILFQPERRLIV